MLKCKYADWDDLVIYCCIHRSIHALSAQCSVQHMLTFERKESENKYIIFVVWIFSRIEWVIVMQSNWIVFKYQRPYTPYLAITTQHMSPSLKINLSFYHWNQNQNKMIIVIIIIIIIRQLSIVFELKIECSLIFLCFVPLFSGIRCVKAVNVDDIKYI